MNSKPKRRTRLFLFLLGLTVLCVGLWCWGNKALVTSSYVVKSEKLPESFAGYTIAAISDLHNASFGKEQSRLLKALAKAEPDLIVITGDLVDSRRTDFAPALDLIEGAVEIAPVYYVPGNHESRIPEYTEWEEVLQAAGVHVLHNEGVSLTQAGAEILLLGVDDPAFSKIEPEEALAELLPQFSQAGEMFTILLSHRPECFAQYVAAGIDLTFAGHAHGGQIRIPGLGGLYAPHQGFLPTYTQGVYTENDAAMVVSRGLGNSLFPLRVNNPPELVVVRLEP